MRVFDTSLKIYPETAVIVVATCFLARLNIIMATLNDGRVVGKKIKIVTKLVSFESILQYLHTK
jgi:hypothetical protein